LPPHVRRVLIAAAVLLAPAAAGAQESRIEVVHNPGEDHALFWTAEERFRLGPALDGPEAFFRVFPWTITTDRGGQIFVLDVGNSIVRVFDADGRYLRELGGRGGGPGEFMRPSGIAVRDDGTITVSDVGKASLVRFDSAGRPLEQAHPNLQLGAIASLEDDLLVAQGSPEVYRLLRLGAADTTTLAETGEPGMITYPGCRMSVPGRPLFAPQIHWSSYGGVLAINGTPDYEISIYAGDERRRVIRREVEPIEINRDDALDSHLARRGFRVTWPGNRCEGGPEDVVEARGFARLLSPITAVSVRPDGQVWAGRQLELDEPKRIDVFDRSGRYLGTLSEGFPFPIAWQSEDEFITFGYSDVGVPYLVVHRIVESSDTPEPGSREPAAANPTTAPADLLGTFEDDYGIRYTISPSSWRQGSGIEYHVVAWNPAGRSLIARNDEDNPSSGGRWTRIDWVWLEDMAPWTWAYCLTVYDAATRDAAESAPAADRASPRTGCNGFPFSRMRWGE
jgi:hypothetical protein